MTGTSHRSDRAGGSPDATWEPRVASLTDQRLADPARSGGKGAGLVRLAATTLPTPPGFVVPVGAVDWEADCRAAYHDLGEPPVAVRASTPADDGTYRSAAGILETRLGVQGVDAVVEAVEALRHAAPAALATYLAVAPGQPLAVIVQRLVPAAVAGVAFSVHPVTQDQSVVVIEAARGLGDVVTAGSIVPETVVVDRAGWGVLDRSEAVGSEPVGSEPVGGVPDADPGVVLDDALAGEVARTVLAAERWLGAPVDMEWAATADGTVYVVQVRPVTTLG